MKAIILISSIFYILGLKIGNKIDLVKKVNPIKTITATKNIKEPTQFCDYVKAMVREPACDSLIKGSSHSDALLKNIEF